MKEKNVGISLLRIFMSFEVVLAHCWNDAEYFRGGV